MIARRHLWIFLLALLLPLAQVAAAAHEVSHVQPVPEMGSKSGLQGGHCDVCALAAQIGGGAVANAPAKIHHAELRQVAPLSQFSSQRTTGVLAAFDSRAPPKSCLL